MLFNVTAVENESAMEIEPAVDFHKLDKLRKKSL